MTPDEMQLLISKNIVALMNAESVTADEAGRRMVGEVDAMLHRHGGHAEFRRCENGIVHYDMTLPPALARMMVDEGIIDIDQIKVE